MDLALILFKKDGSHKAFTLPSSIVVVGRRRDCDLRIPLMAVSRRHCQLSQNEDTLKIRDLGSRNGTYVNNKRIDEATLRSGDYITIGPLTFMLQINGQPKKVVPPELPVQEKAKPEGPRSAGIQKAPAKAAVEDESDIFADLDGDASDSFLAELEDI
jgi:pSer/pThr/pTyr-binding forkhead associated (FHA) protein